MHDAPSGVDIDDGFSDADVEGWMETAIDPIESATEPDDEVS